MHTEENMFIDLIETSGWAGAFQGMRNPMNSWYKADTIDYCSIGKEDLALAKRLIKGGTEHRKFLRMINVQFNLNAPRYIWSEFDTYKIGTTANSCSTMHKLLNKDEEVRGEENATMLDRMLHTQGDLTLLNFYYHEDDEAFLQNIINRLNMIKQSYLKATPKGKIELLRRAKQLLPEGYLQMRTINTNYETLMNIYKQRKNHRLNKEWGMICEFIKSLPYMEEFLIADGQLKEESNE